jgi:hypothetical protein
MIQCNEEPIITNNKQHGKISKNTHGCMRIILFIYRSSLGDILCICVTVFYLLQGNVHSLKNYKVRYCYRIEFSDQICMPDTGNMS